MKKRPERKIVIDHDPDPDFSWLEQDHYKPGHKDYSPVYPTSRDMRKRTNAYDPEWYTNPDNHVALSMIAYERCDCCEQWRVVDSLGGIDFLVADGVHVQPANRWQTGTFTTLKQLPARSYLRSLAKGMGLR